MSVTWVHDPILKAYLVESDDPEPLDGLFTALDEILAVEGGNRRVRILVDHAHPPTTAMVGEGMMRLLGYLPRLRGSSIVLVLPGQGDHGIGRLATLMLGDSVDLEVFNDMPSAVVSLTMDESD